MMDFDTWRHSLTYEEMNQLATGYWKQWDINPSITMKEYLDEQYGHWKLSQPQDDGQ